MLGKYLRYFLILFASAMPPATAALLVNKHALTYEQKIEAPAQQEVERKKEVPDEPIPGKAAPFEAPSSESVA